MLVYQRVPTFGLEFMVNVGTVNISYMEHLATALQRFAVCNLLVGSVDKASFAHVVALIGGS